MRLSFLSLLVIVVFCEKVNAQEEIISTTKTDHYFGVQANQLLRQLFDLGGTNTIPSNSYTLIYAANSALTGRGINAGFGYTFNEFNSGDAVSKQETKINDLFLRIGYERKKDIGKRWLLSTGVDIVLDRQRNKTTNTADFGNNNTSKVTSDTKINGMGLGPRFSLSFRITDRIFLGTEASYYFKSLKDTRIVESETTSQIFDQNTGQLITQKSTDKDEIENKNKRFSFSSPAVLFLILKM